MEQRSQEWFALRAGKFTGSRFAMLMAKTKSGPAASRRNLIALLAIERMTGACVETYQNSAMLRGTELEPEAIEAYEDNQLVTVQGMAFITHAELDYVGVSPDGMVGDNGMVEVKCPSAEAKHLDALLKGSHATEYKWQLQGQLWVAERDWVDAVSYDPRWPEKHRIAVVRVERNDEMITELKAECITANGEVNAIIEKLK